MVTERDIVRLITRPFPVIVSAPSGAGKTSVAKELRRLVEQRLPYIHFAVSLTTRPQRDGEIDGADYHFVTEVEFEHARSSAELVESAIVHGKLYGTPRSEIDRALEEGYHVLLDVDVQGGEALMRAYPEAVSIFLLPPSHAAMEARLRRRGTEAPAAIESRLAEALKELESVEHYQYLIVNRDLDRTVDVFIHIIHAEEYRRERKENLQEWLDAHFPKRRVITR